MNIPNETETEGVSGFIDLGLPSGTLWSANYEKEDNEVLYAWRARAEKCQDLPKVEDYDELWNCCRLELVEGKVKGIRFVGPNGNSVILNGLGNIVPGEYEVPSYRKDKMLLWARENEEQTCAIYAECSSFSHFLTHAYDKHLNLIRLVKRR